MASDRNRAANRDNARKSTGPKSAQGKAKVSGNARRHGFSARGPADEHAPEVVRRIADAICGDDADPMAYELAMVVADAQVSITRVRAARITAIKDARTRVVPSPPVDIIMQLVSEASEALARDDMASLAPQLRLSQSGSRPTRSELNFLRLWPAIWIMTRHRATTSTASVSPSRN